MGGENDDRGVLDEREDSGSSSESGDAGLFIVKVLVSGILYQRFEC